MGLDRSTYLEERHGAEVTWRPFDLHPEIPARGVPVARLPGGIEAMHGRLDPVARLAAHAGLPFRVPGLVPRTLEALAATEWMRIRRPHAFAAFHRALFVAYWGDDRDIGDRGVILDVAASNGVDPSGLGDALEQGKMEEAVRRSTAAGLDAGVTGTPAWLLDGRVLVPGAQDRETFDRVVERLPAAPSP